MQVCAIVMLHGYFERLNFTEPDEYLPVTDCGYTKGSLDLGLGSRDWYHGEMTQDEAEEVLTASGSDCFLTRHCQQMLVLSLLHCGEFHHLRIKYGPGGYELENGTAQYSFLGLDDLIEYYRDNPLSKVIGVKLDQTCDRIYTSVLPITSSYNIGMYTSTIFPLSSPLLSSPFTHSPPQ